MLDYFNSIRFSNLICILLLFTSCNDLIPDLQRDNPLDGKNPKNTLQCINTVVVYDTYGDNIPSPGETIYLKVYLKNNSSKIIHFVSGTFSTESPYVKNLSPEAPVNFWSGNGLNFIEPEQEGYGVYKNAPNSSIYSFRFELLPDTPENTEIPFHILITDIYNNEWKSDLKVTVKKVATDVRYLNYDIVYEDNLDGTINKGETAYLKIFLLNAGINTDKEIKGVISSASPYISNLAADTVSYLTSNLSSVALPGEKVFGYLTTAPNDSVYSLKFNVSTATPPGTEIPFVIKITDIFSNIKIDTIKVLVK